MGNSISHRTPLEQFLYDDCKKRIFLEYSNLVKQSGSDTAYKALSSAFHDIDVDYKKAPYRHGWTCERKDCDCEGHERYKKQRDAKTLETKIH